MAKRRRHQRPSLTPDNSPVRRRQRVSSPELSPFPEINWARVRTPPYRTQLNPHPSKEQLLSTNHCDKSDSIATSGPEQSSSSIIVEYTRALSIADQQSPLRTSPVTESHFTPGVIQSPTEIEQPLPILHSTPIVVQVCLNNIYSTSWPMTYIIF